MRVAVIILILFAVSFLVPALAERIGNVALANAILMIQTRFALQILMTSSLLHVAGPCLCLAAPRDVKGTGYLLSLIGLNALTMLAGALGMFVTLPEWLSDMNYFVPYVSILIFVLFVRRVAIYLERQDIRRLARGTLIMAGIAVLLYAIQWTLVFFNVYSYSDTSLASDAAFHARLVHSASIAFFAGLAFLCYLRMLQYARRATFTSSQSE
jgi:hypothetical protein